MQKVDSTFPRKPRLIGPLRWFSVEIARKAHLYSTDGSSMRLDWIFRKFMGLFRIFWKVVGYFSLFSKSFKVELFVKTTRISGTARRFRFFCETNITNKKIWLAEFFMQTAANRIILGVRP